MLENIAYIEIGGNLGDRLLLLKKAKQMIAAQGCQIIAESSIYETPPWGFYAKQNFYNQVLKVSTPKRPDDLLMNLQQIEEQLGRVRSGNRFASRTMDIDILFFNNEIITDKDIHIPHERLHLRNFVLIPLNELAPTFLHPVLHKTIAELLKECPDNSDCINLNSILI